MSWAQLRDGDTIFQVRVAGVAVEDGRVLLHRMPGEDHWSLPGGRVEVGETAAEALRREMSEEIDAQIDVGGLLWLIENFFEHTPLDGSGGEDVVAHHEIGLYLAMAVPDRIREADSFIGTELAGTPQEFRLEFGWFPRDEVAAMDVRPGTVRDRLATELPQAQALLVQRS